MKQFETVREVAKSFTEFLKREFPNRHVYYPREVSSKIPSFLADDVAIPVAGITKEVVSAQFKRVADQLRARASRGRVAIMPWVRLFGDSDRLQIEFGGSVYYV